MPRIRNLDDPDELRAANAAELDWVGRAPTATPASRVRDVLLIPTSTAEGDWDTHPPVSSPPVDVGRGLKLTELHHDEAELVMNACTPRGHYFFADYLFASPALAERLRRCLAFNPTEWYAFSDHSPIVATFEV